MVATEKGVSKAAVFSLAGRLLPWSYRRRYRDSGQILGLSLWNHIDLKVVTSEFCFHFFSGLFVSYFPMYYA